MTAVWLVFLTARVLPSTWKTRQGSRHPSQTRSSVLITALDGLASKRALACKLLQSARSPKDQVGILRRSAQQSQHETAASTVPDSPALYRRATMGSTVAISASGSEGIAEQTPSAAAACCPTRRLARDGKYFQRTCSSSVMIASRTMGFSLAFIGGPPSFQGQPPTRRPSTLMISITGPTSQCAVCLLRCGILEAHLPRASGLQIAESARTRCQSL